MSSEAVNWVRDHADVPRRLYPLLMTIASYTDREGRGCRASASTLARHCKVEERSAMRLLSQLRDLGVIKPGDQSLVARIAPQYRPIVYDIVGVPPREPRGDRRVIPRGDRRVPPGVTDGSPKTFPFGEGDRAEGAQGSAPRPDANPPPPPPPHRYEYGQFGLCEHCRLPEHHACHTPENRP